MKSCRICLTGFLFGTLFFPLISTMAYGQEKEKKHAIDVDAIRQTELTGDIGIPPTAMNQAADPAHLLAFLAKSRGKLYFTFPEKREQPIRMLDAIPEIWLQRSPAALQTFNGTPQPGEYYVFQIGVYAAGADLKNIKVQILPLKGNGSLDGIGTLKGSPNGAGVQSLTDVTCFNAEGISYLGKPFTKDLNLHKTEVLPLWFGVQIPKNAKGLYTGKVVIRPAGLPAAVVTVNLNVSGAVVENNGVDDADRLSRMSWLNNKMALDDGITGKFIPLSRDGNTVSILGRKISLGNDGLPKEITSFFDKDNLALVEKGEPVLFDKIKFVVDRNGSPLSFTPGATRYTDHLPGSSSWETILQNPDITLTLKGHAEYDGFIGYEVMVKPLKDVDVKDIRLEIPMDKKKAGYIMGLDHEGGTRTDNWAWKWDVINKNQDGIWVGGINGGMRLRLKGANFHSQLVNIYYPFGPLNEPESWGNGQKGGVTINNETQGALIKAFSGQRLLHKDSTYRFVFELLVTPFKLIDRKIQYGDRYYHSDIDTSENFIKIAREHGANIVNIHHKKDIYPYIDYPFSPDNADSLKAFIQRAHENDLKAKLYYTTRELSVKTPEIWALRSLNNEILYPGPGMATRSLVNPKGVHPWLGANFKKDFIPGWVATFQHGRFKGKQDLAILTRPDSRMNNFFLGGLDWMCKNLKIDGIYIDDLALDRETLKRTRKILDRERPGSRIDMHTWNHFNDYGKWANSLYLYMDLLPYIDQLWIGEARDYNKPADYWLIEVSGIPFGLTSQMLNRGGNAWRGMVFGITDRFGWYRSITPEYIWKFWDLHDFEHKKMTGFWDEEMPVKTDNPNTTASIYSDDKEVIIAVANWTDTVQTCRFRIDWNRLGLSPDKVTANIPALKDFQTERSIDINGPVEIEAAKGYMIVLKKQ
ncbi:glycoside hydrolase domain-containing protein [Flavitalea flava]